MEFSDTYTKLDANFLPKYNCSVMAEETAFSDDEKLSYTEIVENCLPQSNRKSQVLAVQSDSSISCTPNILLIRNLCIKYNGYAYNNYIFPLTGIDCYVVVEKLKFSHDEKSKSNTRSNSSTSGMRTIILYQLSV